MKMNKILLAGAMLFASASMMAQETVTEYTYKPNWYIQGQFGGQETVGESSFGHLFNPNAQIAVGYNFNDLFGLRLAVNGWQSKGWMDVNSANFHRGWKWNYVAPALDVTFNLTNGFCGYKPNRVVDVYLIGGIGVNVAFNNDKAGTVNSEMVSNHLGSLEYLWDGTKTRVLGRLGCALDFNVSKHVAIGLELMGNMLNDGYNSKKAGNPDFYVNGLLGIKYTFGSKYNETTRTIEVPVAEPQVIERVIERVVETPAPAPVEEVKAEILRRDVFFRINTAVISKEEMNKVTEVADFLKSHPNAKVEITGYADKGTGTMAINLRLSKQRAQIVANTLKDKYGIPADRMVVKSMGEEAFQPYSDPVDNRVAICVCE